MSPNRNALIAQVEAKQREIDRLQKARSLQPGAPQNFSVLQEQLAELQNECAQMNALRDEQDAEIAELRAQEARGTKMLAETLAAIDRKMCGEHAEFCRSMQGPEGVISGSILALARVSGQAAEPVDAEAKNEMGSEMCRTDFDKLSSMLKAKFVREGGRLVAD